MHLIYDVHITFLIHRKVIIRKNMNIQTSQNPPVGGNLRLGSVAIVNFARALCRPDSQSGFQPTGEFTKSRLSCLYAEALMDSVYIVTNS